MVQLVLYIIVGVLMFVAGYGVSYSSVQENEQYIRTLKSQLEDMQQQSEQMEDKLVKMKDKFSMRIFLVSRKNIKGDDDIAIKSYVCIAKDRDEAYRMGPYGDYKPMLHSWPVTCENDVHIICIGFTPNNKPTVVSISR